MPFNEEKKFREEYARQVLISVSPQKYMGSLLLDRPDIQHIDNSVGIEVTGTLNQRLKYGLAQFSDLYGKPISVITAKKQKHLDKNEVDVKADEEGIIKFIIPAAVWGSGNDSKKAFENKLEKLNSGNYKIFHENNLFLFAEGEEDYEVQELFEHVKKIKDFKYLFNSIYLYTYSELYIISKDKLSLSSVPITEKQKLEFVQKALNFAKTRKEEK